VFDDFVEWMVGQGYARKTIVCYLTSLRAAVKSIDPATVTAVQLREYADALPLARSSRAGLRSALGAYWKFLARTDGPGGAIRVPRKRRLKCKALDEADAARLAAAAAARGDRKGLAVLLGLYTGLRRNEIATLRWADVDDGWINLVGKADREREIPLHPVLLEALRAHAGWLPPSSVGPQRSEWVFPGRFGGPQNPTTVWGWVREVSSTAGLPPVPTHVLRHTALATALDATGDLRTVQEIAGHASPETTAGYTRVTRKAMARAIGAIDYS
jgi:integrase/recombinase XerC